MKELKTIEYDRYENNEHQINDCARNIIDFNLGAPLSNPESNASSHEQTSRGYGGKKTATSDYEPQHNRSHQHRGEKRNNWSNESQPNRTHHSNRSGRDNGNQYHRHSQREEKLFSVGSEYHYEMPKPAAKKMSEMIFEQKPIFVYGHRVSPIASLNDLHLFSDRVLDLTIGTTNVISTVYTYTWPHLVRGNSLILADTNDTTIAYLPAICKLVKVRCSYLEHSM